MNGDEAGRPTLDAGADAARAAEAAVAALVRELQDGWDARDADISNRHFAADILWGSPFGATVTGYEQLHAIHTRLKQQGTGGTAARFEVVRVVAPVL
jgi:ketosteroid isomerase-like protein